MANWIRVTSVVGGAAVLVAAGVVVVTTVVTGPNANFAGSAIPARADDCEAETLPLPEGSTSVKWQYLSPDGRYAASLGYPEENFQLLHDGEPVDVGDLGLEDVSVAGVNSHGTVIGSGARSDRYVAFRWNAEDRQLVELTSDGETGVDAVSINDAGTIMDSETELDDGELYGAEIARWTDGATVAEPVRLDSKSAMAPMVEALAADGTMVGSLFNKSLMESSAEGDYRPRVWSPDGKATEIPVDEYDASAHAVTQNWVLVTGESHSYRWNYTSDTDPEQLDHFSGDAVDLSGRVYGGVELNDEGYASRTVPGVYDTEARKLPIPDGLEQLGRPEENSDTVNAASADGSVLIGSWHGNPLQWRCGASG